VLTYAPGFNPTYAAVYTIELTIAGSLMGGGLGYVFAFFLDLPFEPPGARRAAFLFSFTFTMLIYSLISFPLLSFVDANFSLRSLLLPAIAFISALLAGCLKGVINNLRIERQKGDPDEGTVIKRTSPRSRE
jgi:hypothetical protein